MRIYRTLEIKWYHLLLALIGLAAVAFVILWFFVGKRRLVHIVEDETDIVG
jgi:hypothetical protein